MITGSVASIPGGAAGPLRALILDAPAGNAPVLLFLHGRGEASPRLDDLPHVCRHLSPPFQALCGALQGVTVVAPQAPHLPDENWSWAAHTPALQRFLAGRFGGRRLLATGFSRGGLGVLQLCRTAPGLIEKWGIVDPQRAGDDEEAALLALPDAAVAGWLRFGDELVRNTPFSRRLATVLRPANVGFLQNGRHTALAAGAYQGQALGGAQTLYQFLGLEHQAIPTGEPGV
jgi:hypothetical protein